MRKGKGRSFFAAKQASQPSRAGEGFDFDWRRRRSSVGKMVVGVLSNRVDREDVTAGDHIYSWRAAYLYAHHGIYVGDGMVIHFTRATGHEIRTGTFLDRFRFSSSRATVEGPPCQKCGHLIKRQGVIMSCLDCFLNGGNLYLFEYAVSLAFFLAKARGGTCTLASSDTADVVIHRAQYLLNNGFGMYCLSKNNCEDFAIYCKTGLLVVVDTAFSVGRSGQLASLRAAFDAGGLAIVTSGMYCGMYCVGRYLSDIGVRRDVIKVPVELVEHWDWVRNAVVSPPQGQGATDTEAEAAAPGAGGGAPVVLSYSVTPVSMDLICDDLQLSFAVWWT